MVRLNCMLASLFVMVSSLQAQQPVQPKLTPQHDAVMAELNNEPAAARAFKVNDKGQVVTLSICAHLSPDDIAAMKKLTTLETLTIGGGLPYRRREPPTQEQVKAEKHRLATYPRALPQLGELTSIKHLYLGHVPSEKEMEVIFGWQQLESLSGDIPPASYPRLATLMRLKHLILKGNHDQPLSPAFLESLTALESLSLPPGFGTNTFSRLADQKRLTKIEGKGLSGEALVDYFTEVRGMSLPQALRRAGYWFDADESGKITKLHFVHTEKFDRLYSEKILARLPGLREMQFTHIGARDDQVLQAVRDRPLETLTLTNVALRSNVITEFCKLKSLKHLSIAFSAREIRLPPIADLPVLETLSLGGINDYKTQPTEIRNLPKLVELRVFRGEINRQLVEQFQQLPSLTRLDLTGATISPAAIEGLASMSRLESINLSQTDIGDDQLELLTKLMSLKTLKTKGTRVSVDGRARFLRDHLGMGPMRILEDADVRCRRENSKRITQVSFGKKCGGELIRSAARLPAVEKLRFVMTRLDQDVLAPLELMPRVKEVEFIHCKTLDDQMIAHLVKMPALRRLKIVSSGLTDDSKDALLKLTQLEKLEIRGRTISPNVISEIHKELENLRTEN